MLGEMVELELEAVLTGMHAAASHCLKGDLPTKNSVSIDSSPVQHMDGRCHSWCDRLGLWSDYCRPVSFKYQLRASAGFAEGMIP